VDGEILQSAILMYVKKAVKMPKSNSRIIKTAKKNKTPPLKIHKYILKSNKTTLPALHKELLARERSLKLRFNILRDTQNKILKELKKGSGKNRASNNKPGKVLKKEFELKLKLLRLEQAVKAREHENKFKHKINELKNTLYKKDLEKSGLAAEISRIKLKQQKEKELELKNSEAAQERAVRSLKNENDTLRKLIKEKETEYKKLKENLYLNEGAVKKEIGLQNAETVKLRKKINLQMEEYKRKFIKEKELLEQYLKTAKEETEKLKKEMTIKNMLSNL